MDEIFKKCEVHYINVGHYEKKRIKKRAKEHF